MTERYEDLEIEDRIALLAGDDLPAEWLERMADTVAANPENDELLEAFRQDRRDLALAWQIEPDEQLLEAARNETLAAIDARAIVSPPPLSRARPRVWLPLAAALVLLLGGFLLYRQLGLGPETTGRNIESTAPSTTLVAERFEAEEGVSDHALGSDPLAEAITGITQPPMADPAPVEISPVEMSPVEMSPVEMSPVEMSPVEPSPVEPSPLRPDSAPALLPSPEVMAVMTTIEPGRAGTAAWPEAEKDIEITWITDDPDIVIHWLVDGSS